MGGIDFLRESSSTLYRADDYLFPSVDIKHPVRSCSSFGPKLVERKKISLRIHKHLMTTPLSRTDQRLSAILQRHRSLSTRNRDSALRSYTDAYRQGKLAAQLGGGCGCSVVKGERVEQEQKQEGGRARKNSKKRKRSGSTSRRRRRRSSSRSRRRLR